jgi:hypothetical protein
VEWGEEIGNVERGNLRKLASQAWHKFVAQEETFASRKVMWKWRGFFEEMGREISELEEM